LISACGVCRIYGGWWFRSWRDDSAADWKCSIRTIRTSRRGRRANEDCGTVTFPVWSWPIWPATTEIAGRERGFFGGPLRRRSLLVVLTDSTFWTAALISGALFVLLVIIGARQKENIVNRNMRVWGVACAVLFAVAFISVAVGLVMSRLA
jgi:hypothetical protein